MRNLIDITDLSIMELQQLMDTALDIIAHPEAYAERCRNRKLATLFFEPSTRTRLSFEAAMLELGGSVIGFSDASNSSVSKGESVADTARTVSCYADIIAMRHPLEGAPYVAGMSVSIPLINAGDGGHLHPTQTLADLLTIYRHKGHLDQLKVGMCGDLKYGRTVHSLIAALSRYEDVEVVLISPEELRIPEYVRKDIMDKNGMQYSEIASLEEGIRDLDVLYMTRIQKERFSDQNEYERLKDSYVLNNVKMTLAKEDMIVLHPMPRVNEISVEVDKDHRACYFEQMLNGKYMRMALILKLLGDEKKPEVPYAPKKADETAVLRNICFCRNKKCISNNERQLPHLFKKTEDGRYRCVYCESVAEVWTEKE